MQISENQEKGLMAISLDDSGDNVLRFARMKYSGDLRRFVPDCSIPAGDFVSYDTKKEAVRAAQSLSFPATHVGMIGNRFFKAWGIRNDHRDNYFLARYE